MKKIFLILMLHLLASCAYLFNEKTVEVAIDSSPQGADIFIAGRHYGRTPAVIKLEPSDQLVQLNKDGYGTSQIQLESWQAVRQDKSDGGRCILDALGTVFVLPALSYWSVYCRDFKQPRYTSIIPYSGPPAGAVVPPTGVDPYQRGGYERPVSNMGYNQYQPRSALRRYELINEQQYPGNGYYQNAPKEVTGDAIIY
jgi:hypothetical protein